MRKQDRQLGVISAAFSVIYKIQIRNVDAIPRKIFPSSKKGVRPLHQFKTKYKPFKAFILFFYTIVPLLSLNALYGHANGLISYLLYFYTGSVCEYWMDVVVWGLLLYFQKWVSWGGLIVWVVYASQGGGTLLFLLKIGLKAPIYGLQGAPGAPKGDPTQRAAGRCITKPLLIGFCGIISLLYKVKQTTTSYRIQEADKLILTFQLLKM